MLSGHDRTFNQSDFERRLRHYFSDSAPCAVRYRLNLDSVEVENTDKPDSVITVKLDASASEEENVRLVILECEKNIYPVLVQVTEEAEPVEPEEVVRRVSSGMTLVEAMASSKKRTIRKEYRIIRIGINNNTIVLKHEGERKIFELSYITALKFLELLNTRYTPESGYDYLIKNSQIKEAE